jgi:hypothetical protein
MHVAYQMPGKPHLWVSELVDSYAVIQPGIYFFGKAAAEHAQFYANWCNDHPKEALDTKGLERLTIFSGGAASA